MRTFFLISLLWIGSVHAGAVGDALNIYNSPDPSGTNINRVAGIDDADVTNPVTYIADKVKKYITTIAVAVAICVFIYASITMIKSQGKEDELQAAKKLMIYTLLALFLIIAADVALKFVKAFICNKAGLGAIDAPTFCQGI